MSTKKYEEVWCENVPNKIYYHLKKCLFNPLSVQEDKLMGVQSIHIPISELIKVLLNKGLIFGSFLGQISIYNDFIVQLLF